MSIDRCPHGGRYCRHSRGGGLFFVEVEDYFGYDGFSLAVYFDLVDEAEEGLAGVDGVAGLEICEDAGGDGFCLFGRWGCDFDGLLVLELADLGCEGDGEDEFCGGEGGYFVTKPECAGVPEDDDEVGFIQL